MAVPFPEQFSPHCTARKRSTLHTHKTPFGDGYRQRMPQSINPIEEVWDLEFRALSLLQGNILETFLADWKGVDQIIWRAPDRNAEFTWEIENYDRTYGRGMHSTVAVTLRRFSDSYTGGWIAYHPLHTWLDFSQVRGIDGMRITHLHDRANPERRFRLDERRSDLEFLGFQAYPGLKTNFRNGLNVIVSAAIAMVLDPAPTIAPHEDFVVWLAGQSGWLGAHDSLMFAGDWGNDAVLLYQGRVTGFVPIPDDPGGSLTTDIRSSVAIDPNRNFAATPIGSSAPSPSAVAQSNPINPAAAFDTQTSFSIWTVRRSGGVVYWHRNGFPYGSAIYTGGVRLQYLFGYANTQSCWSGWIGEIGAATAMSLEKYDELINDLGRKWNVPTFNLHE